ncbi:MAG: hypothetical protein KGL39_07485 [Patescibacteria group bacterium]|nr:hypothetical protein [Patescibacteria group bacterium]
MRASRQIAVTLAALALSACAVSTAPPKYPTLIYIQAPAYAPPDVGQLAKSEIRAAKRVPLCLAAIGIQVGTMPIGLVSGIIPLLGYAVTPINLLDAWLGSQCLEE